MANIKFYNRIIIVTGLLFMLNMSAFHMEGKADDVIMWPTSLYVTELALAQPYNSIGFMAIGLYGGLIQAGVAKNLEARLTVDYASNTSSSYGLTPAVKYVFWEEGIFHLGAQAIANFSQKSTGGLNTTVGAKIPFTILSGPIIFGISPRVSSTSGITSIGSDIGISITTPIDWLRTTFDFTALSTSGVTTTFGEAGLYLTPSSRTAIGLQVLSKNVDNSFTVGFLNAVAFLGFPL